MMGCPQCTLTSQRSDFSAFYQRYKSGLKSPKLCKEWHDTGGITGVYFLVPEAWEFQQLPKATCAVL